MRYVPPGMKIIVDELLRSTGRLRNSYAASHDALLQSTLSWARRHPIWARLRLRQSLSRKASAPIGPWSNSDRQCAQRPPLPALQSTRLKFSRRWPPRHYAAAALARVTPDIRMADALA